MIRRAVALSLLVLAFAATAVAEPVADKPASPTPARGTAEATVAPAVAPTAPAAPAHRIVAYYFHTTRRCPSCRKIEAWSAEAIQTAFAKELGDSVLTFLPINTDEKGNEHFVDDYQIYTKSLILVEMKDGARQQWKNLPKVWECLNDRDKFFSYVRDEVRAYLDELS